MRCSVRKNRPSTVGQALRRTGLLRQVIMIGFDATPALVECPSQGRTEWPVAPGPGAYGVSGRDPCR